jgi:hypothetical protein
METASPASLMNNQGSKPTPTADSVATLENGANSPSMASTPSKTGNSSTPAGQKRIDVDGIMTEFRKRLGDNWDRYREVLTHFLIGKWFSPQTGFFEGYDFRYCEGS